MARAHDIRDEIAKLTFELQERQKELASIERSCHHAWREPVDASKEIPGYQDPGDPPGTCGIDRRLPFYVPTRTIEKWTRICRTCGKIEETSDTEVVEVRRRPKF